MLTGTGLALLALGGAVAALADGFAGLAAGRLLSDEVVCMVAEDHPIVRAGAGRAWTVDKYLACEHVAPTPNY